MTHLDEGTLQAYLDDELPGRRRAAAAEHLLVCGECRRELDALKRANATLADALALIDIPAPAAAAPAGRGRRGRLGFGGGSLVRAAVLVLLVAAAASASVPGSPVREWIAQAVRPAKPAPAIEAPAPVVVEEPAPERPAAPAGISVPGLANVDVVVTGARDMAIRLVRSDEAGVSVSARGGTDPLFRMGSGRIEVVGGIGGELMVAVPRAGADVRLVVDGRRYAVVDGAALEVVVEPVERDGEDVVWR